MYADGEKLIATKVKYCEKFGPDNVTQCNWKVLNTGKADHYAILRPGPFDIEWLTPTVYRGNYTTIVEVWQRYKDDGVSQNNLYLLIGYLMTGLQPERFMDDTTGTIQDATISGSGAVAEMWNRGGRGPAWLKWEINVNWKQQVEVTY